MFKEIFKNYDAFYNMVLSTTIMANTHTLELDEDAKKIIEFIGKAYKLNDDIISKSIDIILDKLQPLGLITDQLAIYSNRDFDDDYSEKDTLFDIKGDVLMKLHSLEKNNPEINSGWFDYSHYKTYQADVRFSKINITSATGNLICTRQVGILKALGIGCKKSINEAIKRLSQCVFWGDIPSMYFLAYAHLLAGNSDKSELFYELAQISQNYLLSGYTVLPDEEKEKYSEEARSYYIYISTIKQDIVYAYNQNRIDFSFIEAITSDSLDYFQRMYYINNYDKKEWKNITNSTEKPSKKLGFK